MEQRIVATAVAALALAAACGTTQAQSSGPVHRVAAVIASASTADLADQREVIAPPSDVDPDMAIVPPATGARMPIIPPPEAPGGRFGIER
jgi:hypothetical protein